jgi:hypothetical protein
VVPLISTYVSGPLGLLHVPRLWLKALLHTVDILAEDWGCGPGGLDKFTLDAIGVDKEAFLAWSAQELPAYDAAETWIQNHATNLTAATIGSTNEFLLTRGLPLNLASEFRDYLGIDREETAPGIMLNNYDDWDTLHRYLHENAEHLDAIVPAISPGTVGLSGIPQLPRLWVKDALAGAGALPSGYELLVEPADDLVLAALGLEPSEARAHLRRERPTFVQFESFILAHAKQSQEGIAWDQIPGLDAASIAAVHQYDWRLLHEQIVAYRATRGVEPAVRPGAFSFEISGNLNALYRPKT